MPPAPIFARAQPKSIKVTEKYYYDAAPLNQFMHAKPDKEQEGAIEITIPYDGQTYFTPKALDDINRQRPQIWVQPDAEVRIGHLAFAEYGRTDLGRTLALPTNHDVIPIEVPIQHPDLPRITSADDSAQLLKDQHAWKITHKYKPNLPQAAPVILGVRVYDEAVTEDLNRSITRLFQRFDAKPREASPGLQQRIINTLTQQDGFKPGQIFEFRVNVQAPAKVGKENDDKTFSLERLAIHWPVTVSPQQVSLEIEQPKATGKDKTERILYDPTRDPTGAIEWRKIALRAPAAKSPSTGLFVYESPVMRLVVKEPGELYQVHSLAGKLEVRLPRPFSTLQVQPFVATGGKGTPDPEYQTQLHVDFQICLEAYAQQKVLAPYQHYHFEGVVLEEARVLDIQNVLTDLGFSCRAQSLSISPCHYEYHLIRAEQTHGLGKLQLWLLCEGRPPDHTLRTRHLVGQQAYTTYLKVGNLKLYLRGQLTGNHTALLQKMNTVHLRLKALFQNVNTIY